MLVVVVVVFDRWIYLVELPHISVLFIFYLYIFSMFSYFSFFLFSLFLSIFSFSVFFCFFLYFLLYISISLFPHLLIIHSFILLHSPIHSIHPSIHSRTHEIMAHYTSTKMTLCSFILCTVFSSLRPPLTALFAPSSVSSSVFFRAAGRRPSLTPLRHALV